MPCPSDPKKEEDQDKQILVGLVQEIFKKKKKHIGKD